MALGRLSWQQHPFCRDDCGVGSENAVDSLYFDRLPFSNQCTLSYNSQYTAEWRVDLGSVVSISHINIFYRTDNLPSMILVLSFFFFFSRSKINNVSVIVSK